MSNAEVLRLVVEMEGLLEDPGSLRDPALLEAWNRRFREAVAGAERGEGWSRILDRAHALAPRVDRAVAQLGDEGRVLREDLEGQGRGERALRGYGAQRT